MISLSQDHVSRYVVLIVRLSGERSESDVATEEQQNHQLFHWSPNNSLPGSLGRKSTFVIELRFKNGGVQTAPLLLSLCTRNLGVSCSVRGWSETFRLFWRCHRFCVASHLSPILPSHTFHHNGLENDTRVANTAITRDTTRHTSAGSIFHLHSITNTEPDRIVSPRHSHCRSKKGFFVDATSTIGHRG